MTKLFLTGKKHRLYYYALQLGSGGYRLFTLVRLMYVNMKYINIYISIYIYMAQHKASRVTLRGGGRQIFKLGNFRDTEKRRLLAA